MTLYQILDPNFMPALIENDPLFDLANEMVSAELKGDYFDKTDILAKILGIQPEILDFAFSMNERFAGAEKLYEKLQIESAVSQQSAIDKKLDQFARNINIMDYMGATNAQCQNDTEQQRFCEETCDNARSMAIQNCIDIANMSLEMGYMLLYKNVDGSLNTGDDDGQ